MHPKNAPGGEPEPASLGPEPKGHWIYPSQTNHAPIQIGYKYKCLCSNTNTEEWQIIPLSGNNCGDRSVHEPQQQLPL